MPYIAAYTDLRKGPVVLEVPAKTDKDVLYGQVVDAWQTSIADVGPEGLDQGKGAKLLFLPPGYKEAIPAGYLPVKSTSYRIAFAFRSVHLPGATDADAYAYSKTLRMYYLSQAANPPQQKFIDPSLPSSPRFPTLPFYDIRYLNDVHDIVSVEPVHPRDKVMMGMLASLGIEAGKPFNPQGKLKAAMERGVVDAYFYLEEEAYKIYSANPFWPNRHWSSTLQPDSTDGFGYVTDDAILLDARGMQFFIGTYYPEKYAYGKAATMYMRRGRRLQGKPVGSRQELPPPGSEGCSCQGVLVADCLRHGDVGVHLQPAGTAGPLIVRQVEDESERRWKRRSVYRADRPGRAGVELDSYPRQAALSDLPFLWSRQGILGQDVRPAGLRRGSVATQALP